MENYFSSQRDHIFRNVEVLIYVFDIESRENQRDLRDYRNCLEAILQVRVVVVVFFKMILAYYHYPFFSFEKNL